MLTALLRLLESHRGEIEPEQICTELRISPATLQNLLDLLVRKGYITRPQPAATTCGQAETCLSTGRACPGPDACGLVLLARRQVSFSLQEPENKP